MLKNLKLTFFIIVILCIPLKSFSDIAIIVNKDVSTDSITSEEVKSIFLGHTTNWPDKEEVTFFILKRDNPLHKNFLKKYIRRTPMQFEYYWRNRLFTGEGSIPIKFSNIDKLIDAVSKTKGAISYCDKVINSDKVKTLTIK